jgi:hypothetical protein
MPVMTAAKRGESDSSTSWTRILASSWPTISSRVDASALRVPPDKSPAELTGL